MSIAVYAAISKELGLPLRFPGTEEAYRAIYQLTSASILAKARVWAGQSEAARDEIFNITNGDVFRWRHLWPRIARMFNMDVADPVPTPLTIYMADKTSLWNEIARKHKLNAIPYDQVASWPFADAIFNQRHDNFRVRLRHAGPGSRIASTPRTCSGISSNLSANSGLFPKPRRPALQGVR